MDEFPQEEKVDKGLTARERREDIKKIIRELGFWRLPNYRRLGERYGVSHSTIHKDIKKILSTLDPKELDEGFTEFLHADKKAQNEIRKILTDGSMDQKIKAVNAMIQLQNAYADLLERYGKKPKVATPIEVRRNLYDDRFEKIYQKYHGKGEFTGDSNQK